MANFLWLTDTHLNFLDKPKIVNFFLDLESKLPDGIFLTGDISNGTELVKHLKWMTKIVHCPIYFILGNHDYYRSSFKEIDDAMLELRKFSPNLRYMNHENSIHLSKSVALIGQSNWYDALWRQPLTPMIFAVDFFSIKDFRTLFSHEDRLSLIRERAQIAANEIGRKLRLALAEHDTVYCLTHVPPWPENEERFYGLVSEFWKPYNSSKIMADTIETVMSEFPDKKVIVLSGHTHREVCRKITDNIELRVGRAKHNVCQIQETVVI